MDRSSRAITDGGNLAVTLGKHLRRARNLPAVLPRLLTVREPLRYAVNEWREVPLVMPYTVRGEDATVCLRHHSPDGDDLVDVFRRHRYAAPAGAQRCLDGLRPGFRAADLGAGTGLFGLWLVGRRPDAVIDAYEPDHLAAVVARRTARANGRTATWTVAIGVSDLETALHADVVRVGPSIPVDATLIDRLNTSPACLVVIDSGAAAAGALRTHGWTVASGRMCWAWRQAASAPSSEMSPIGSGEANE
jgi:hypothetical protein